MPRMLSGKRSSFLTKTFGTIFSTKAAYWWLFSFMCFVYIIYSEKLNRFYIGHSIDLAKRLEEHNAGISAYTSKAKDWKLVYSESFDSRDQARNRKKSIKAKKSRKYIEFLIAHKTFEGQIASPKKFSARPAKYRERSSKRSSVLP